MRRLAIALLAFLLLGSFLTWRDGLVPPETPEDHFISYVVQPKKQHLRLYWRDEKGVPFRSIQQLKQWLAPRQRLVFAMNAGMYRPDHSAQGLFIEDGHLRAALDSASGRGNFYLKPNGIFYLTADDTPFICPTPRFPGGRGICYATQSGPLLLLDGRMHPAFRPASTNVNIRNGVGILPDGRVLFAMSKVPVTFYAFAAYFQQQGCRQALYLDGSVSRTYLPEKNWTQTDGDFGVIIGVTK